MDKTEMSYFVIVAKGTHHMLVADLFTRSRSFAVEAIERLKLGNAEAVRVNVTMEFEN